jgi:UDP-2,3-diacylglucosamine pyrophosphatase LpxH
MAESEVGIGKSSHVISMMPSKAYFLSDLHLFANRSVAEAVKPSIDRAARESHTLILGGDIFDFRWNRWHDQAKTIAASIQWLEDLLAVNPDCQIKYLLGNHDALEAFTLELDAMSRSYANLEWHPHLLRWNGNVFLHGDVIDARVPFTDDFHELLDERRKRKDQMAPPAKFRHRLYDVAVTTRVHRLVANVANPKTRVLSKISDYLEWAGHGISSGVRDVYFGHTHCPMESEPYSGLRFHNPGATIKGMNFRIIEIPLPRESTG